MQDNLGRVKKIGTLKGKSANTLFWSPQGKNIVLAGLKSLNGQLEFFNVDEFETMATTEHFMCTDVDWDPTGRYVTTSVTSVHQMENGFNMWAFNGRLLYRTPRDRFFQVYSLYIHCCSDIFAVFSLPVGYTHCIFTAVQAYSLYIH
jgi:translation initiation factor 3 subunit B